MGLIRQISDRNGSWYYHDSNLGRLKISMNLRWSDIEHELFIIAMIKKYSPFAPAGRPSPVNAHPNATTKQFITTEVLTNLTKEKIVESVTSPTCAPSAVDQTTHSTNGILKTEKKTLGTTNQLLKQTELRPKNQTPQNQAKQAPSVQISKMHTPVKWLSPQHWLKGYD